MRAPRASRAAPIIVPARAVVPAARARAAVAAAVRTRTAAAVIRAGAAAQAVKIDPAAAAAAAARVAAAAPQADPAAMEAAGTRAGMRTRIGIEIRPPAAVLMKLSGRKTEHAIGRVRAARSRPVPPAMAAPTEIAAIEMVMDGEAITIMVADLIVGETETLLIGIGMSANVDAIITRRAFTRLRITTTTVMGLAPTSRVTKTACAPAPVMRGRARVMIPSARISTNMARADFCQCSAVGLRMLRLIAMVFCAATKRVIRTIRLTSLGGDFAGDRLRVRRTT